MIKKQYIKNGVVIGIIFSLVGTNVLTGGTAQPTQTESLVHLANRPYVRNMWSDNSPNQLPCDSVKNDNPWSSVEVVSTLSDSASEFPDIAVAPDGTAHCVWQERFMSGTELQYNVYYRSRSTDGTWLPAEKIAGNTNRWAYGPFVGVDAQKTVYVVWDECDAGADYDDVYYRYKPAGGAWSDPEIAYNTDSIIGEVSSLAVEHDGTLHITGIDVYINSTTYEDVQRDFYTMKPSGGSWGSPEYIAQASGGWPMLLFSSVGVDEGKNVYVTWDYADSNGSCIYYKEKPWNNDWTPEEVIDTTSVRIPILAVQSDGTVHLIWQKPADLLYRTKTIEGSWSPIQDISDGQGSHDHDIAVEPSGTVHVVWRGPTGILYRNKASTGGWGGIEGASFRGISPSIAVDATGVLRMVWEEENNQPPNVLDILYRERLTSEYNNAPPETPSMPAGPSGGYRSNPYTFTTHANDPDRDQIYYLFDWGDYTVDYWRGPYPSGATFSESHQWDTVGTFWIKVIASDSFGHLSNISEEASITINEQPLLKIGSIYGGVGVKVIIQNTGLADATNVKWTINISGGTLARIDLTKSGSITTLGSQKETMVKSGLFFGLGKINANISVQCNEEQTPVTESLNGKIFIFFITQL